MRIPKLKQFELIEISWIDIVSAEAQLPLDFPLEQCAGHKTVGFYVRQSKGFLYICATLPGQGYMGSDEVEVSGTWCFPKGCITKIRRLK